MGENVVVEKSFTFALKIVNVYKHLSVVKKEFVLSKQLLRTEQVLVRMCVKLYLHNVRKILFQR